MPLDLIQCITADQPELRNQSIDALCQGATDAELQTETERLDQFWRHSDNLYARVRALFFLYAIHRFHLPHRPRQVAGRGRTPYGGYRHLLARRFEEAIDHFRQAARQNGLSDNLASALASAYHLLAFQTLANQVRRSVRSVAGNQWMFRVGHPTDHPLRLHPALRQTGPDQTYPLLHETTPVRMDLSHSAWSDIFFLGMDYPEGARVLNVSIDLGVRGRDTAPRPPVEAYLRVIDEPVLRLTSIDLGATADVQTLHEVFDFARDYLGLLKAAVIAAGLVPPGLEGGEQPLRDVLEKLVGPGQGLEVVSQVNDIPKGSRLAVSTNLLAALIAVGMRATGQTQSLTGSLTEPERRLVAARAILGEWLAGSGGGWQDSGGVWPGIKLIQGEHAQSGDPEHGISRGCLLPRHTWLGPDTVSPEVRDRLQQSLVLVHGGMAQNVGPILEMVTEKYLLRTEPEWTGRQRAVGLLDTILTQLQQGNIRALGEATTENFYGPIQTIIPWAHTWYTERLIQAMRAAFADDFWGFWMLGGMSGGGMGFMVDPAQQSAAKQFLQQTMVRFKEELQDALPFAMDPVVYDFAINENGTQATLHHGRDALFPPAYYAMMVPRWLRMDPRTLTRTRRAELHYIGDVSAERADFKGLVNQLFERMLPDRSATDTRQESLRELLHRVGFDPEQQAAVRNDLRNGLLGLAQNRLPATTVIEDVEPGDVVDCCPPAPATLEACGQQALRNGEVAVITLAAGTGSRWTQGAGVVKALHPFCALQGRHRSFIETHLAKSRRQARAAGASIPHIFTTSYLTHDPIAAHLERTGNHGYEGPLYLSPGRSVGIRMIPMMRDLRFLWEETAHQQLDEQAEKMRGHLQAALLDWAQQAGEGRDYTDNVPLQCLHPVGHWYEPANLLLNGILRELLQTRPQCKWLLLHNIDTVGADLDPGLLGRHIDSGAALSFEVISRRIEDLGGGLARVNGRLRIVEGLALPREDIEFRLSYYNSMTTWIDLDQWLALFGLTRNQLADEPTVSAAVRRLGASIPSYITIKDVKKRWGQGQEDIFPVSQYEKLWSDMTALPEAQCRFFVVPRPRGQQLKDQAQLDGWLRDGSADWVSARCDFGEDPVTVESTVQSRPDRG